MAARRQAKIEAGTLVIDVAPAQEESATRDGDWATLTDTQLERLQYLLERNAFGDDQAKIMAARRQAKIEAGTLVIDVAPAQEESATPSESKAEEEW